MCVCVCERDKRRTNYDLYAVLFLTPFYFARPIKPLTSFYFALDLFIRLLAISLPYRSAAILATMSR